MDKKPVVTDKKIIELYFERSGDAVAETDGKYGAYISAVIKNFVDNCEDCRECQNDVYLRVWNSIPPNRPASLKSFIGRIARNTAVSFFRKASAEKRAGTNYAVSLEELSEAIPCFDDTDAETVRRVIGAFLKGLPSRNAGIFVRRYYYAENLSQIAGSAGLSVAGVHKTLEKMKAELKKMLENEGINV